MQVGMQGGWWSLHDIPAGWAAVIGGIAGGIAGTIGSYLVYLRQSRWERSNRAAGYLDAITETLTEIQAAMAKPEAPNESLQALTWMLKVFRKELLEKVGDEVLQRLWGLRAEARIAILLSDPDPKNNESGKALRTKWIEDAAIVIGLLRATSAREKFQGT